MQTFTNSGPRSEPPIAGSAPARNADLLNPLRTSECPRFLSGSRIAALQNLHRYVKT